MPKQSASSNSLHSSLNGAVNDNDVDEVDHPTPPSPNDYHGKGARPKERPQGRRGRLGSCNETDLRRPRYLSQQEVLRHEAMAGSDGDSMVSRPVQCRSRMSSSGDEHPHPNQSWEDMRLENQRRRLSVPASTHLNEEHVHRGHLQEIDIQSDFETATEGGRLYVNYMREEIRREGLREPECLAAHHTDRDTDMWEMEEKIFHYPVATQFGLDLRNIADRFAESRQRRAVTEKARNVNIRALNKEKFMDMLAQLFEDGEITGERIIVLFCFCRDLAIAALKEECMNIFHDLMMWSLKFILERVCRWVQQHGGWGSVLQTSLNVVVKIAITTACVAVVAVALAYVRKNW